MKTILSGTRLIEILSACKSLRVGVFGDFALDAYFYADMTRAQLSRETPLYNRPVVAEKYSPGGAANVAWNLKALGCEGVFALTVLGDDWRGEILKHQLARYGIHLDHVFIHPHWVTPLFGKMILTSTEHQQEDSRVDFINIRPLPSEVEQAILARVEKKLPELDALVIADYLSTGVVTGNIRTQLCTLAEKFSQVVFVADSREHVSAYRGMVIKPNELEAIQAVYPGWNPRDLSEDNLRTAGRILRDNTGQTVFITMGQHGCIVIDTTEEHLLPAIASLEPIDPVGAGDTFLSGITVGLATDATNLEAGALATLAAGVTVRKFHITGTASKDEILALYQDLR